MSEPLFSILLPTRQGAALVGDCVKAVLDQPGDDFELVVSDNANDDGTSEVLAGFGGDHRLKVVRQDTPVSVVENWNAALHASSGQYVLLIGDDDLLLPWYFERARALLERFDMPDCLSYNGYRYAFPGFVGETSGSHYADPFFTPHPWLPREGTIDANQRRRMLADFFSFIMPMTLNLQVTLVARDALARIPHPDFRAPFPDFYALLALLVSADRWVITDEQLVVVGVSSGSFSQSLSDENDAKRGMKYLGVTTDFERALPGNDLYNGIHVCLSQVKADYEADLEGLEIDRAQYVFSQLIWWYAQVRLGMLPLRGLIARLRLLGLGDWMLLAKELPRRLHRLGRWLRLDSTDPTPRMFPNMQPLAKINNIAEFGDWLAEQRRIGQHDE